jgi:hypothetical protein
MGMMNRDKGEGDKRRFAKEERRKRKKKRVIREEKKGEEKESEREGSGRGVRGGMKETLEKGGILPDIDEEGIGRPASSCLDDGG